MQSIQKQCFLSEYDQRELRKALQEGFPKKTVKELDAMFQQLIDTGGEEGYIKRVNGKITKIGVIIKNEKITCFNPEINYDSPWLYKD